MVYWLSESQDQYFIDYYFVVVVVVVVVDLLHISFQMQPKKSNFILFLKIELYSFFLKKMEFYSLFKKIWNFILF